MPGSPPQQPSRFRLLARALLGAILLSGPLFVLWVLSREMSILLWSLPAAAGAWLALLAAWYLVFGGGRVGRRFARVGIGAAALAALAGVASLLLRYEGSVSGTSMPRFSWVWQEPWSEAEALDPDVEVEPGEDHGLTRAELEAAAGESPDFLGPSRDGTFAELAFDPDWAANPPRLLWRRPVGRAWSSFAVADGIAVTQEQSGDAERVLAVDLLSGRTRWHYVRESTRLLLVREENAGAAMGGDGPRATPVAHAGVVYAMGATGALDALELETGRLLWSRRVIEDFGGEVQRWGQANSPLALAEEGLLVVPGSDRPGTTLAALGLEDGEVCWTYEGEGASYSSPRLLEIGGERMVVSVNARDVTAHEPADGRLLWRHPWPGATPKVGQPLLVGEDRLLLTASYGVGSPLLRVEQAGGEWRVEELWRSTRMKTKFSSASVLGGHAYGIDEGRLAGIDLETGERVWKRERFGFGQQLLFGDHLLVQTEPGDVVVGRVGPAEFEERGRIPALGSMTWNAPVVAGRILLARNDREAVAYWLPPARD